MDLLLPLVFHWHRRGRPRVLGDLLRDGGADFVLGLLTARVLRRRPLRRRRRPAAPSGPSLCEVLRVMVVYFGYRLFWAGRDLFWAFVMAKIGFKRYRYRRILQLMR